MYGTSSHIFSAGKVIINILILKVFVGQIAFSQNTEGDFCGTPDLTAYIENITRVEAKPTIRRNTISYYPIQIFSVARSNGEGRLNDIQMMRGLCTLNDDFYDYGIQFYLKNPVKDINNDDYFNHNQSNGYRMMRNHNVSGAFNIYIVDNPNGTCGYFSPANEAVALAKNCFIGGTHALTHEMGHFFGLPHTFQGWEQKAYDKTNVPRYLSIRGRDTLYVETVDGSNCMVSGDGFCDTPPDYISERWSCDRNGLSSVSYLDPKGEEFYIDGTNFMSYALDRCQNMFTPEQVDRMYHTLDTRYSSRKYKFVAPDIVRGGDIKTVRPAFQADVDINEVELEWEPLPDAEEYIVQLSILSGVLFEKDNKLLTYTTTDTKLSIPAADLRPEIRYYWRVFPKNGFTFCLEPSKESSFTPQIKSNTHLLPGGDQIMVFPNIIQAGESHIQLTYNFTTPRDLQLSLYNLNGQQLSMSHQHIFGESKSALSTANLVAGMYVLHISDGKNVVTQKLMVQ